MRKPSVSTAGYLRRLVKGLPPIPRMSWPAPEAPFVPDRQCVPLYRLRSKTALDYASSEAFPRGVPEEHMEAEGDDDNPFDFDCADKDCA